MATDKRIIKLRKEIATRELRIFAIQEECGHVGATRVARSYFDEAYQEWDDCHCKICDKRWVEDQ